MGPWLRRNSCLVAPVLVLGVTACRFDGSASGPTGLLTEDGAPISDDAGTSTDASPDASPDATPFVLMDNGLVIRYFMDEASTGQLPMDLVDSAADPLNIPITYGQAVYVENAGNRGLHWQNALGNGKAEVSLGSPKLASLREVSTTTMEIVVDVDGADASTIGHVAGLRGSNPDLILSARGDSELLLHRPYNALTATWVGVHEQERMVLHVVYDATLGDPERRVDLYKNGVLVDKTTSTPPPMGDSETLSTASEFIIGNQQDQTQSIAGTIYYVAVYDRALTPSEVSNNAQRLLANDDQ